MNRLIPIFVVIFAAVFAGSYVLMQPGSPTLPTQAAISSQAQNDESKSSNSISPGGEVESASAKPADEPSKDETQPAQPSPRAQGQRKQKAKQTVKQRPPKQEPQEINSAIWDEDLDRLRGSWRMVDAEYDGERNPDEARNYSWDFKLDRYTINHNGNFTELWAVEVDSSRYPKIINSTGLATSIAPVKGKKLKGIYEVTDDTLKVCYDLTGNDRPDSFKAGKGSRCACYYFKR